MPYSKVDIVNMGLAKLGVERISSFSDNVKAARMSNDLYDLKRDEVLRTRDWDFARKRVELGKLSDPSPFGEFLNRFQIPGDCLIVRSLEDRRYDFRVEAGILLTNQSVARVLYTRRETDTSLYDPNFIDALATRLAVEFCMPLIQDPKQRDSLRMEYKYMLGLAGSYNAQQGTPAQAIIDTWLNSRSGTGRPFGPGDLV